MMGTHAAVVQDSYSLLAPSPGACYAEEQQYNLLMRTADDLLRRRNPVLVRLASGASARRRAVEHSCELLRRAPRLCIFRLHTARVSADPALKHTLTERGASAAVGSSVSNGLSCAASNASTIICSRWSSVGGGRSSFCTFGFLCAAPTIREVR